MPCSVMMAGGPASTNQESKYPGRGDRTFTSFPSVSSSGVQSTRSSDVAMRMSGTLNYIQYLPFTLVAMTRFPCTRVRIAPYLDSGLRSFPPAILAHAGPVLGAVPHVDLAVLHHGGRIEGGVLLPTHAAVTERRAECGGGSRRDGRIHQCGLHKGTEHPLASLSARWLARQAAEEGRQRRQRGIASHHRPRNAREV